ncbi:MAG TPA: glycosyltransferase [Pyrinomonadaceae bacterium]|nr:glycosyltransferase [Pyrinomonadaceae bacterium]
MRLDVRETNENVYVVVPQLPDGLRSQIAITAVMKEMTYRLFLEHSIDEYVFWYYTPMALRFTKHFNPLVAVYDCMDELSAFKDAPADLPALEKDLFRRVDLVFTGGQSLYEAKRNEHRAVYSFPSSIDAAHFGKARTTPTEPPDQADIPHPRLGFFGVIDERFDRDLLDQVASRRPEWQFVIVGPMVKIDPETLPKHPNIHYLGARKYEELPTYLAGWDIALLLFARNDSTRFISPTKTPEYLAAGKRVISTSIRDVVRPYGELKLVEIADTADEFISAAEQILSKPNDAEWLARVDAFLANVSWDKTWKQMSDLIDAVIERKRLINSATVPLGRFGHRAGAAATP